MPRVPGPRVPLHPSRFPVFYGWVILAVGTLGVVMSAPGQTIGVSAFTDHLLKATGLTRLQFSNAYLVGTLAAGFLIPYGGRLLDRFGARVLVVASTTILGLTLAFLAASDRVAGAVSAVTGAPGTLAALLVLVTGFTALRFSGQGMLTMVSQTMIGKWFDKRRGLVAGISGVFVSFGFAITPLALTGWIEATDWRTTWFGLALLVGVGMGLLGWIFYRDNPEEVGLRMDGGDALTRGSASHEGRASVVRDFTRAEALRTRGFWAINGALIAHALILTGVTFHIVSIGAEAGLDPLTAVSVFLPLAVVSTTTGFIVGALSDRVRLRHLIIAMMAFEATGLVALTMYGSWAGRALVVAGLGVSAGFFSPLSIAALPRYFGRKHLGAINGVRMSSVVFGSALGPSLLAFSYHATGAYDAGFLGFALIPLAVILLAWGAENPQHRYREASSGRIVVHGYRLTGRARRDEE